MPAGATSGPIAVTATAGTVTSATNFVVVAHRRNITLKLRKDLVAKGRVSAADDFAECESGVTVKVQRRHKGGWRTIDTHVEIQKGRYRESLQDRKGKYRAAVRRVT